MRLTNQLISNDRIIVNVWQGDNQAKINGQRNLSQEEKSEFGSSYINKLVGFQCRVLIKNKEGKEGKVFSNIDSFLPKKETLS